MKSDAVFQMTQLEKAFKKIYEKDGHALLERPMTYEQYLQLDADQKALYGKMEEHRGPALFEFFENVLYERKVSPYIIYPTGNDEWLQELVLHMVGERRKKDYLYNESVSLMVRQMFIHILRNYELLAIVSDPICHMQENRIVALMGYIAVNYRSITLAQTADFFGYSRAYMSQMLSKYTGKTFTALVDEEKMKHAARLIEETGLSLTEIGVEVGCYDASHFTHKFKKIYGMTPTEYRARKTT